MHDNDHSDNVLPVNHNSLEHDNSALELLKHENDYLMELLISQDLVHTAVNSLAAINDYKSMQQSFVDNYNETLVLKAELGIHCYVSATCPSSKTCNDYLNDVNSRVKSKSVKSRSAKSKKKKIWKPTGKVYTKVIQIVLWYLDSGCSKHMTGQRSQLINFVSKFLETIRFRNDQIAKIMGYDLEVAFRKHTCYVQNLDGADLLYGSKDTNLYTISLDDMLKFTCVKILRSKDEAPEVIIKCLKQIKVRLNATVQNVRTDNGTKFVNQTLREYYENVRISHQTSVARTPQQNGVVKRQNRTLVEVARTMLIFSKAPLFLLAEVVNIACYTQIRSLIHLCYNKTPYELMHDKKPDIGIFVGYAPTKKAFLPVAAAPRPANPTGSPVSTSINQDAPSTRSSSNVRSSHALLELLGKWTKNYPLANVIKDPSRSVSIRKQLKTDAMWCYFDAFLTSVEPKNFKEAMLESSWIEAMQE
ncbi:retrovirus-related pol polyprotein from transposon TNT 1-94 [Tanacetum coccineum]